jgi:hypothetical protein
VDGPYLLYVLSICARIALRFFPWSIIFITSRVMPMQMPQPRLIRSKINFGVVELSLR